MMQTFVVYVENKPGVLSRVIPVFRRRGFNIDSLTVGRTEKPEVSRMTIVTEADPDQARRIVANLYKLLNVLFVDDLTNQPALMRDLALVKVNGSGDARTPVLKLAEVFKARVLDLAPDSITTELTGREEKIDRYLELLEPFGLLEVVRTGVVAMRRGATSPTVVTRRRPAPRPVDDDAISHSV